MWVIVKHLGTVLVQFTTVLIANIPHAINFKPIQKTQLESFIHFNRLLPSLRPYFHLYRFKLFQCVQFSKCLLHCSNTVIGPCMNSTATEKLNRNKEAKQCTIKNDISIIFFQCSIVLSVPLVRTCDSFEHTHNLHTTIRLAFEWKIQIIGFSVLCQMQLVHCNHHLLL